MRVMVLLKTFLRFYTFTHFLIFFLFFHIVLDFLRP